MPDSHAVYSMMDDVTSSCLPTCIPEDIRDEMITNAKRLIEIKDMRKAFNNIDFEVPRDHTSRPLTLTESKNGVVLCTKGNVFILICLVSVATSLLWQNLQTI